MKYKQQEPLSLWPGEALRQALDDVRWAERCKSLRVHMGAWVRIADDGICVVCVVGASMIRRLGADPDHERVNPEDTARPEIQAMELFRAGNWYGLNIWASRRGYLSDYDLFRLRNAIKAALTISELSAIHLDTGVRRLPEWYAALRKASYVMDDELRKIGWEPKPLEKVNS